MTDDRRHFNRVTFNTIATLTVNRRKIECQIIDLSIHGALLKLSAQDDLEVGANYQLDIPLSEDGKAISMEVELMHHEDQQMGLKCVHIDLDSITHLRRLVELNLGDSALLERDFLSLVHDNQ